MHRRLVLQQVISAAVLAKPLLAIAAEGRGLAHGFAGQLLVATDHMGDPRFAEAVIYMVSHDGSGAMGIIVNRSLGESSVQSLLSSNGAHAVAHDRTLTVFYGGPVDPERGFVLHSPDYDGPSTRRLSRNLALSTGIDVLLAMAAGKGPQQSRFTLGYAGWGPGQLDREMDHDAWFTAPAETAIIFADDPGSAWSTAMMHAGTPL